MLTVFEIKYWSSPGRPLVCPLPVCLGPPNGALYLGSREREDEYEYAEEYAEECAEQDEDEEERGRARKSEVEGQGGHPQLDIMPLIQTVPASSRSAQYSAVSSCAAHTPAASP
jgi:hypothetical protein